jgi:hypothetical protein
MFAAIALLALLLVMNLAALATQIVSVVSPDDGDGSWSRCKWHWLLKSLQVASNVLAANAKPILSCLSLVLASLRHRASRWRRTAFAARAMSCGEFYTIIYSFSVKLWFYSACRGDELFLKRARPGAWFGAMRGWMEEGTRCRKGRRGSWWQCFTETKGSRNKMLKASKIGQKFGCDSQQWFWFIAAR